MKQGFICIPPIVDMDEWRKTRDYAIVALFERGYTTYYKDNGPVNYDIKNDMEFLAELVRQMSQADGVYFCKGWDTHYRCKLLHTIATEYKLDIFYE
jgi:hypothetical protein